MSAEAEGNPPEARAACEHFYASHCHRGMSIRLCMTCGEPDWDDFAEQLGGVTPRVSTHWAVAFGSKGVNDGIGFVEQYDDEEDARGHLRYYKGGASVVKRTVISLPWEIVPAGEARDG